MVESQCIQYSEFKIQKLNDMSSVPDLASIAWTRKTAILNAVFWLLNSAVGLAAAADNGERERLAAWPGTVSVRQENTNRFHRPRLADRTWVFSRALPMYGHFQNYTVQWIDRPLHMDRSLRYPPGTFQHMLREDFIGLTAKEAEASGLDALGQMVHDSATNTRYFRQRLEWMRDDPSIRLLLVPDFARHPDPLGTGYAAYLDFLRLALQEPRLARVQDKCLVTSYYTGSWDAATLRTFRERLRADAGESWMLAAGHPFRARRAWREAIASGDPNRARRAGTAFRDAVRETLRAADGIVFEEAGHLGVKPGPTYAHFFDEAFYTNSLVPALLEVLAEPGFAGRKLLGLSAANGYVNYRSGENLSEEGTRTLRKGFEAARGANPDFISLPEWNEVNENTCIQPTVLNAGCTRRILLYYQRGLRGQEQAPIAGDDVRVPNLVVSSRCELRLGERLDIEILRIPDAPAPVPCTIRLSLRDAEGRLLKRFPPHTFRGATLDDVTYTLPSEALAADGIRVVRPELEVDGDSARPSVWRTLRSIVIQPTTTTNYKYARQPLRELFEPEHHRFTCERQPDGAVVLSADIRTTNRLASVEVLEGYREIHGVDPGGEFDRGRYFVVRADLTASETRTLAGRIAFTHVSDLYTRAVEWPNSDLTGLRQEGHTLHLTPRINRLTRAILIRIPRGDVARAVMEGEFDGQAFRLPFQTLDQHGGYAVVPARQTLIRFFRMDDLADIPPRLNALAADFRIAHRPSNPSPVYFLRVISDSGRIWRSTPLLPVPLPSAPLTALNVWSETAGSNCQVHLPAAAVPQFDYLFEPKLGALLPCSTGPAGHGELGGGLGYSAPFNRDAPVPAIGASSAPAWVRDDDGGGWCLQFDGGQYATLPHEVFPRGEFTLTFEIEPRSQASQVLFRHHGISIGSLTLVLRRGNLHGSFVDHRLKVTEFDTGLPVPAGVWSTVVVAYDLHTLRFTVNGQTRAYPYAGRALYFAPSVFGGHSKPFGGLRPGDAFFTGRLRRLGIRHQAERPGDSASDG